jgi:hypothetical protein
VGLVAREVQALRETQRSLVAGARWLWARRPPPPRAAAIAFTAALAAAGFLSVLAQARLRERLPSAQDWSALRALLEREARPGDAVAIAPHWAERARELLPSTAPVLSQERYLGEDLVGVRRIWQVSLASAPGFSRTSEVDLLQLGASSDPPARIGALEVTRYTVALPVLPLTFLPDRLAQAEVSRGGARCLSDAAGLFLCRDGSPAAAREMREVAGAPRPCLVAFPGGSAPLEITFPSVRLGGRVRGHVAAIGAPSLEAPLRVAVLVDGEETGSAEISGEGFKAFQVDTTRFAGLVRPVSLVLTSPATEDAVCLDAVTLP